MAEWLVFVRLLTKSVGLIALPVLARLLAPIYFGLAAISMTLVLLPRR